MDRQPRKLQDRGKVVVALGAVAAVLALAGLLIGCGGSGGSGNAGGNEASTANVKLSSAEVPEVTMAFVGQDVSLNLFTSATIPTIALLANVTEGMLAYEPNGSLRNGLVKNWQEVSPTEYLYTLRSDARFSTGKPVTAADVLYSLKYAMNPKTGSAASSFYLTVKSIEQVGANQIRVKLKQPDPTWRYVPGDFPGWIYEKKSLVDAGENFGGPQGIPVGSGPYAISEFTNDHITFVRNKYYSGPKPPVAKFDVRLLADPGTSLAAMQSGDVDGALFVPMQSTNQWEAIEGVSLHGVVSPAFDQIWYNTTKAPFDDPYVRRALFYALNREQIAKGVLHENAKVYSTYIPPQMWLNEMSPAEAEARSGEMGREYPFDMGKAKSELAKSAHPDGFSATAYYPSSAPELGLALQAWSESLKELNVNLEVRELGDTPFYNKLNEGTFEVAASTGGWDYPDPLDYKLVLCGCAIPPNGFNAGRYDNPKMNRLFDESYADTNKESRVNKIIELVALADEEQPLPALWLRSAVTALKSELTISGLGPWSFPYTAWMTKVGEPAA